ncbi:hypothetical protein Cni_G13679 [Canna indica]|uniref:non-specific serine/threonine protein kinase n=1 Tax=Canna indica TaxID=4628 RepID=A0AAQ3QA13_9LILI|nr:hypothetical protein Cni_G13679 [Canna indica]
MAICGSRILPIIIFCLSIIVPLSTPLSFNFTSFDETNQAQIQKQNDTEISRNTIQLTRYQRDVPIDNSTGRAQYKDPMLLWDKETKQLADFTTHFVFAIDNFGNSWSGDGLAFFLSSYPSTIPNNSGGGSLGLFDYLNSTSGTSTVAVEFDTFSNYFDPTVSHVGIDVNSIKSTVTANWSYIRNGTKANAWVTYNASTHNLSVFLTYAENPVFSSDYYILSDKINLQKELPEMVTIGFSAATGAGLETHTIYSWSFDSTLQPRKKSKFVLVISIVGSTTVMTALGLLWFIWTRRKNTKRNTEDKDELLDTDHANIDEEIERETVMKRFLYNELANATKNFSEKGKLGEGGFGPVYKGFLKDWKLDVAIKRVSRSSKQGRKEYLSEVKIISRLRHRNLVQLVGWCHDRRELLLVYEFVPNGSLDSYLFSSTRILEWPVRYKIALGLASALLYLHEEWDQCVVHRDIKSSNVLLDSAFIAKLGDFGLARLVNHNHDMQTTFLAGTRGYMAPEYLDAGKASKESDVYSFGIVTLEIACGRRTIVLSEEENKIKLVEWVWELYGRGAILEAADEKLNGNFDKKEMECLMLVGLWCAHPNRILRPSIGHAINALNLEAPLPELPSKMPVPIYCTPATDRSQSFSAPFSSVLSAR